MRMLHWAANGTGKAVLVAILCSALMPSRLFCGDNAPPSDNPTNAHHTVRDLEMKIEVVPDSKKIKLTIITHSPEARYHMRPPGLIVFRAKLTDENGRPLKMTSKGLEEFNEPAAGSVRLNEMRREVPFTESIDLAPLFEFPQAGRIRCEVSRLVHFTDPRKKPSESEWIRFPPVTIVVDDVSSPQIQRISPPVPRAAHR